MTVKNLSPRLGLAFAAFAFTVSLAPLKADWTPPEWWSTSDPPIIDTTATPNNHGIANIGQAKHMVWNALLALYYIDPMLYMDVEYDLIVGDLVPPYTAIVDLTWASDPKPPGWSERQHQPLSVGQLKALARPFYEYFHLMPPHDTWLESELVLNQTKDAVDEENYYPWTSDTGDDDNDAPATVGQLKAAFAFHFETMEDDYDSDGLSNFDEQLHYSTNQHDPDTDDDGTNDGDEVDNGTNPLVPHPSEELTDLVEDMNERLLDMLDGKTPSDTTRNIFSSKNHSTQSYTRNSNLWCNDVVADLTGCAVWKPPFEYVGERYGGVMITPRHILFCQHAHPDWDGGWMEVTPQVIRFVKADGTVVNRTMIASAQTTSYVYDIHADDLCVGLLDEEVPSGIHIAKIMPFTELQTKQLIDLKALALCVSQSPLTPTYTFHESRAYPLRAMTWWGDSEPHSSSPAKPWWHEPYNGDSGTPIFLVTSEGLNLCDLTSLTDQVQLCRKIDAINALIEDCDESAVEREVLDEPTGEEVSVSELVPEE